MPEKQLHVELIAHTPIPEQVSALAAKLCYAKADVSALRERISVQKMQYQYLSAADAQSRVVQKIKEFEVAESVISLKQILQFEHVVITAPL